MPTQEGQREKPRLYCGMGNHTLQEPSTKIASIGMLAFAKRWNPELTHSTLICISCYEFLEKIFRYKQKRIRQRIGQTNRGEHDTNSLTDVSSSALSTTSSSSRGRSASSRGAGSSPRVGGSSPRVGGLSSRGDTPSSQRSGPTTSAAAAAKRKRTQVTHSDSSQPTDDPQPNNDDDDDNMLSLNAVNGTRLPHIQPIPKRRQFVHLNKEAMDIYLAGTTGG
ncbi:uncharacterized protein LOC115622295 [Scaptodrosophila lebanonensis]|uniref:Uncharacterized protein LOC115622295 n=1 Tax=Drosophila lebanonensis TaxID=7225 RepID=A0A6J2TAC2_DROLE|nr:uncharacterized protein LOC115622295 [Scaptodrosophila lebanonensis]